MSSWEEHYLAEFKAWYTGVNGFGDYLRHFLAHYGPFFRELQETHLFVYTKLHSEFKLNIEQAVDSWRASKGITDEHFHAMLTFAKDHGDEATLQIVDMLILHLEYPSWISYMFSLKQNSQLMYELWDQKSKPGWDNIDGSEVKWETQWWEQWSENEWEQWNSSVMGGRSDWQGWTDGEWDEWWAQQKGWDAGWNDKVEEWKDKTWSGEDAGTRAANPGLLAPAVFNVQVPEGAYAGTPFQVTAPNGQLLSVTVPEGVQAGQYLPVQYLPS